jgi:putative ABC transport system permease protein
MLRDLKLAFRAFRKRRGYAATAALTLAVGVGSTTAIFAFVDAALLQPPPFPEPSRLGVIWGVAGPERNIRGASFPEIADWKARTRSFAHVASYDEISVNMRVDGGEAVRVDGETVSAGFFPMLGATSALGRTFNVEEESVPDQHAVAVISDALWRRTFAANPDLSSLNVAFNDRPFAVIGVMQPGFHGFSSDTDVWIPAMMMSVTASPITSRSTRWMPAIARLKDGVSRDTAQADLDAAAASLAVDFPDTNTDRGAELQTLEQYYLGSTARTLRMLFGAVLLLLLVACSNVAALQLARSASRRHETAVSLALGASRRHLVRQLAAEAVVLGAAGAALGALLALWLLRGITALQPSGALPAFVQPALDARAILFASAMAMLSALAAAVLPALVMPSSSVSSALRTSARAVRGGLGSIARPAPQQILVIAQVAVALALLLGAGLVIRTLQTQLNVPLGFDPRGVTVANVTLTGERYTPEVRAAFAGRLAQVFSAMPGVSTAAVSDGVPFGGSSASILVREPDFTDRVRYYAHSVGPDYFRAIGMRIVAGQGFTGQERLDGPRVAVVSESGARRLFPGRNAVGLRFRLGANGPDVEIVGIAADARFRDLVADLGASRAEPDVFFPFAQRPGRGLQVAIRSTGAAPTARQLQEAVWGLDPALPIFAVTALVDNADAQTASARFTSAIMGGFGVATLLLAGIGLYGLVSYVVGLSRREIALRLALGAERYSVVRLILRNGMALVVAGIAAGLALAWLLGRVWGDWIGADAALDRWTAGIAIATLAAAGIIAAIVPAFGAASVDPNLSLRTD